LASKRCRKHAVVVFARIVDIAVAEHDDEGSVGLHRDVGLLRQVGRRRRDGELRADRAAGIVVALAVDPLRRPVRQIVRIIDDGEVAIGEGGQSRVERVVIAGAVDREFRAERDAVHVEDADRDLLIAVVADLAREIKPGHGEAAGRQADDLRVCLRRRRQGVDLDLAAHRRAGGVVALGEHALAGAVLPLGIPDDHIAAIGQRRDMAVVLIAWRVAVGLDLVADRDAAVDLRRDRHRHRLAQDAAVAIGQLHRDQALRVRVVGGVGVGQRLDQRLDRLRVRRRVQHHDQRRAVGAVGLDHADRRSVDADHAAADAHAADRGEAQLILCRVVRRSELGLHDVVDHHRDGQPAAGEIGRIRVAEADRRRDLLRRGLEVGLVERHGVGQAGQNRVVRDRHGPHRREDLLEHAVIEGPGILIVRTPQRREGVARQLHEPRLVLRAGRIAVEAELAVLPRAVGGVDLREDVARVVVVPRNHPAAGVEADHVGLVLGIRSRLVDPHLSADRDAHRVVALQEHCRAAAVRRPVRAPHHNEAAIGDRRDPRFVLVARCGAVDPELAGRRRAVGGVQPRINAVSVAVARHPGRVRGPGRHITAAAQHGDVRVELGGGRLDVHLHRPGAERGAGVVEDPQEHARAGAVIAAIVAEHGHDVAIGARRDLRFILRTAGEPFVDQKFAGGRRAGLVEDPRIDARRGLGGQAGRVGGAVVGPRHREAAGGQARRRRLVLRELGVDVDLELRAHRVAVQVVALGEHAGRAVLRTVLILAAPHHDIADLRARRVIDRRRVGLLLIARREGVDLSLVALRKLGAVGLRRHIHRDHAVAGRAAVAIGDLHRELPARRRIVRRIGVAEPGEHALHGLGGRIGGVERDPERGAVDAVIDRVDGPHRVAVDRDHAAGDGHAIARQNAELVLRRAILRADLRVIGRARADDARHQQRAAHEIARVHVAQRQRAVLLKQHEPGVDRRLVERHLILEALQHRVHRARGNRRLVEQLLEHALIGAVARGAGGHGRPGCN
jgi:hypothetical protein